MTALKDGLVNENRHRGPSRIRSLLFLVIYFVRYGCLAITIAVIVGCEIVAMAQRNMQWRGDLIWTIDWLPVSFIVIAPVSAGFAAVDTARSAVGLGHLFYNHANRTPAAAVFFSHSASITCAHLFCMIAALTASQPPVWDSWAPLAILVQVLMLCFFVSLGTLIGRFARPVSAGLFGAVVSLLLMYLGGTEGGHFSVFAIGGATLPRIGYEYDPHYLLCQAVILSLCVVAFMVPRPKVRSSGYSIGLRDSMTVITIVMVITAAIVVSPNRRLVSDQHAEPTLCGDTASIPACFYPQHRRIALEFTDKLSTLVKAARENGYSSILPNAVFEASRTRLPQVYDSSVGAFYIMPANLQGVEVSFWQIASGIIQPLQCDQLQSDEPPSDRYWQDLGSLTATWVALIDPVQAEESGYPSNMPPAHAATIMQQFRECTYPFSDG